MSDLPQSLAKVRKQIILEWPTTAKFRIKQAFIFAILPILGMRKRFYNNKKNEKVAFIFFFNFQVGHYQVVWGPVSVETR